MLLLGEELTVRLSSGTGDDEGGDMEGAIDVEGCGDEFDSSKVDSLRTVRTRAFRSIPV